MVEIKGITLPVVAIRIKKDTDINTIKEEISKKIKGKLFKGSYFIIENSEQLEKDKLEDIENFLKNQNLESINRVSLNKEADRKPTARLLIVDRSLRSGQKVEYCGDILVLGDVNKDAEVIAVGNIIVMGSLRGIAIAGALGDERAVVIALKMEPQQIRIGKKIAISNDEERTSPGYPEVAKIEDGIIVLEKV